MIQVFRAPPDVNGSVVWVSQAGGAEPSPVLGEMLLGCAGLAEPWHCFSLGLPGTFHTNAAMHSWLQRLIIKEGEVIHEETEKK